MNKTKSLIIVALVVLAMLFIHTIVPWTSLELLGCGMFVLGLIALAYGNRIYSDEE